MREAGVHVGVRAFAAAFAMASLAAATARAQGDEQSCRNGLFPTSEAKIGRAQVIGKGRLVLLDDAPGCPAQTTKCRANTTSVAAGAELLTGHRLGAYVCAFDPVKDNAGYVESARLKPLPVDASPPLKAWVGAWRQYDDKIELTAKGASLVVSGEAYWPSAHAANANEGDLSGTATPKGAVVVFADSSDPDACRATLRLVGDVLVAADNQNCGGMNVSFSGVYRRK